ncbi:chymotrypsin-2 [Anabrus simplex]|uniref:chymotrypsin-2 n=1 Tax=Anabrus simplex TaxID=316456 RepID=UPI0035A38ECD
MQAYICVLLVSCVASSLGAPQLDIGSRVINGENASPGEIPYIVSLRRGNSHFCGGSILNANWVITAAHCVVSTSASSVTVVTGTTTLNAGGNKYSVSRIINHSGYSAAASWRNDIALLKVASPIQLSSSIQPVKLPAANKNQGAGLPVLVSGWGYSSYPGWTLPNNLQKLNLQLVSNEDCQSRHTGNIYETSVCASAGNGKGVCNGDSGGPLVEASSGELVGIVSWGRPCAVGYPDVYTRVAKYIDWINANAVN